MGTKMVINDALVLGGKDDGQNPVTYGNSPLNGEEYATFRIGVRMYDASYADHCRYNNFFVSVPADKVDTVRRLNLQKNSMVHLITTFDYSKDVLSERKAVNSDPNENPNYGKSRSVKGVVLRLLDIEYAGTTSSQKRNKNEQSTKEGTPVPAPVPTPSTPTTAATVQTTSPLATSGTASSEGNKTLEEELDIPVINLDEKDIFGERKMLRKFF